MQEKLVALIKALPVARPAHAVEWEVHALLSACGPIRRKSEDTPGFQQLPDGKLQVDFGMYAKRRPPNWQARRVAQVCADMFQRRGLKLGLGRADTAGKPPSTHFCKFVADAFVALGVDSDFYRPARDAVELCNLDRVQRIK